MATASTMRQENQQVRDLLHARVLRVNATVMSVVVGLLMGLGLFGVTNFLLLRDGPDAGPHLSLLGQLFIGYRVTFVGSLIGFAWASASGFVATYAGTTLYNWLADRRALRASARRASSAGGTAGAAPGADAAAAHGARHDS